MVYRERGDVIRQDDDELVPQAHVVHRDPRETRGRYRDDKVWGGSERISFTPVPVAGGGFLPVDYKTNAEMVRLTLRPPRLCGFALVWTPVSANWNADGGTYTVQFLIAFAVGRSREEIVQAKTGLVAPFTQLVFTPFGTVGASPTSPLILPVRTLYVSGRVFSTANPTTGGRFDSRFSAYGAPFFGDFGDPDGDEG